MFTQSLTPASSTDWLPSGMPARVSLSQARASSGVISLAWLKWMFIQIGWYLASISHSSSSIRWGRNTGTREPMRMISMWGISRRPRRTISSSFGRERQAVAAGDQHVADLRRAADVVELRLVVAAIEVLGRVADDPASGCSSGSTCAHCVVTSIRTRSG